MGDSYFIGSSKVSVGEWWRGEKKGMEVWVWVRVSFSNVFLMEEMIKFLGWDSCEVGRRSRRSRSARERRGGMGQSKIHDCWLLR